MFDQLDGRNVIDNAFYHWLPGNFCFVQKK